MEPRSHLAPGPEQVLQLGPEHSSPTLSSTRIRGAWELVKDAGFQGA